jgi:hypothetical protein
MNELFCDGLKVNGVLHSLLLERVNEREQACALFRYKPDGNTTTCEASK